MCVPCNNNEAAERRPTQGVIVDSCNILVEPRKPWWLMGDEMGASEQQRQRGNEANEKAARPLLLIDPHKNDPTLKAQLSLRRASVALGRHRSVELDGLITL